MAEYQVVARARRRDHLSAVQCLCLLGARGAGGSLVFTGGRWRTAFVGGTSYTLRCIDSLRTRGYFELRSSPSVLHLTTSGQAAAEAIANEREALLRDMADGRKKRRAKALATYYRHRPARTAEPEVPPVERRFADA